MKYFVISLFLACCFFLFYNADLSAQSRNIIKGKAQTDSLVRIATGFFEEAEHFAKKGQTDDAISLAEQAQHLYKVAEYWKGYVDCSLKITEYLDAGAGSEQYRLLLDHAIKIAKQYLGEDHKLLVKAFRLKGELYIDLSQLDSATLVLSEAIRIGEIAEDWEELAWALVVQSVVNLYEEDYTNMESHIDQALTLAKTKIEDPTDHFGLINTLQSFLFEATGNFDKAFTTSQNTLEWRREKSNLNQIDSLGLANAYNIHGSICFDRGDYDQAVHHYKIALDLHKKLKSDFRTLVGIGNNISLSYKRKTDWEKAQFYLEASKSLLPERPDETNFKEWIRTHQFLASNLLDQGKYESAIILLEKLLPISHQYNFNENWNHSTMGNALLKTDHAERARQHFRISLSEMQKIHGNRHPNIAEVYRLIGTSYLDQKKLDSALPYFQKALIALSADFNDTIHFSNPALEDIDALTEFLPALASKAKTLAFMSQEDAKWESLATNTYRLAAATIDRIRENQETEEAKLLLSTSAKRIYEGAIQCLHQLYSKRKDPSLLAEAFQYAEKSKSLLLLEMIRSSEARQDLVNPLYAGDTLFYQILEEGKLIKTELLFFEQKLKIAQGEKLPADHARIKNAETALARLYQEDLEWKNQVQKLYPAYYDLKYDEHFADIESIRKSLLFKEAAFLEYFIGEQGAYLFVITDQDVQFLSLANRAQLIDATRKFQNLLSDHHAMKRDAELAFTNYNQAAHELYKILLEEVTSTLSSAISKLIIVPDNILNTIPFEALNTKTETRSTINFAKLPYLLYDYQIHYGYSANLLLVNRSRYKQVDSNTECLALAPPYANQQIVQSGSLNKLRNSNAPLEGTGREIRAIASSFSGRFEFGSSATESFFKQKAQEYGILHLAMHGVPDYENPNFAHLKFTNLSNDTLEDNLLHHYEIANLKLNSQLTVLSACETGLGKYEEGEGVFSLARSFMYAGVPSVVMSLWKIDDQSTARLMPLFYTHLAEGLEKDVALQKAKKDYMSESDLEFRHPYYWSGIVLLGDEQALKKESSQMWWYLLGIAFLVPALFFLRRKSV